jgi:hypothetical protein
MDKVYRYYSETNPHQKEVIVDLIDGSEIPSPFSLTKILENDNDAKLYVREELLDNNTTLQDMLSKLPITDEEKSEFLRELLRYLTHILGKNAPVETPPRRYGNYRKSRKARKSKSRKSRKSHRK